MKKYKKENAEQVEADIFQSDKIKIINGDFLNEKDIIRHDSNKIARVIIDLP